MRTLRSLMLAHLHTRAPVTTPIESAPRHHVAPSESIVLNDRARALGSYPHARRVGDLIFVSGTSSRRPDNTHEGVTIRSDGVVETDIRAQTHAVLRNIDTILRRGGASLAHIIDITTFLVSMDDFPGYNEVYNTYFNATDGPTRTTVAVAQLPHPNLRIEIKAIAAVGAPANPTEDSYA